MKRIISLLLVLILSLSMLFLAACDEDGKDKDTEPPATTVATTESVVTTAAPEEPVAVEDLNGKTVKQLVETFMEEYSNAKSFDISMNMVETIEGETEEMDISFKITDTEAYVYMNMYGEKMSVWYVDGVVYVESSDGKFKSEDVSVDDILGEDFIEEFTSFMPTEIDDMLAKKYDEAQLYYFKNAYYVTITFTDEEAEEMGADEAYSETFYFDKDGKLRKMELVQGDNTATVILKSYGETVKIDPPENASEFEGPDDSGMPPQLEEV